MVPFAGYELPVNYSGGIIAEHLFTREKAGLFDVSHMGQAFLSGRDAARKLRKPGSRRHLRAATGPHRYTQFTNEQGGILDDLMVDQARAGREGERLFLVVNAACKAADFAPCAKNCRDLRLDILEDRALLALQGPAGRRRAGAPCHPASRDGLHVLAGDSAGAASACSSPARAIPARTASKSRFPPTPPADLADALLAEEDVRAIGLGARNSLRLEAGLCLYGHDIDATTSPVEAALTWSISNRRRDEGGFPGAARVRRELARA